MHAQRGRGWRIRRALFRDVRDRGRQRAPTCQKQHVGATLRWPPLSRSLAKTEILDRMAPMEVRRYELFLAGSNSPGGSDSSLSFTSWSSRIIRWGAVAVNRGPTEGRSGYACAPAESAPR